MSNNMPVGPPHLHHPPTPHAYSSQQHQSQQPQQQQPPPPQHHHQQQHYQPQHHHHHHHHQHSSRRQNEFHPQPQYQFNPYHHNPYQHAPPHPPYYGGPMPQYMPHQWYPPYQHFPVPPPPQPHARHFQPQAPLVVSSNPHAQPVLPTSRAAQHAPQYHQQPQASMPEQSPSTMSQAIASPSTTPTTASIQTKTPPASHTATKATPPPASTSPPASEPVYHTPFAYPLPWYSVPESSFPPKSSRRRRRRKYSELPSEAPEFPARLTLPSVPEVGTTQAEEAVKPTASVSEETSEHPMPATIAPKEASLTDGVDKTTAVASPATVVPAQRARAQTRPVVPIIPNLARRAPNQAAPPASSKQEAEGDANVAVQDEVKPPTETQSTSESSIPDAAPIPKQPPSSWASLFSRGKAGVANGSVSTPATTNGAANGSQPPKSSSLADALRLYNVDDDGKITFLEPRGLVNTGNMCYMNSILQVLVFCAPFYEFLDQVSKRAAHSFKSNTPLVEAMIMFMREYQIIDSAPSVDQLRMRLKDGELEQYGEPFIPEYVYEAIKRLPRFSSMRRGQQQDAEEFLGLLLEVLHLECAGVMISAQGESSALSDAASEVSMDGSSSTADAGGWMEVGHKQKPSVTRSSGGDIESPITKIFGGKLRSEFRVSGNKNSVTLTPYQQLQLDIGDPSISNVIDALKGLTRSERVDGTFQTPRGPQDHGTKQFFIETLPPVLILHLKRFHFEGNTTQKIWKKIGYPLELEMPKEVFAHNKRGQLTSRSQGLPKYRLLAVVYHHGKNASGGHYTVDVRRQEGREWIRLDDTVIRRVRADDVAGEGGEEDPHLLAKALEQHKRDQQTAKQNIFTQAGFADDGEAEGTGEEEGGKGWSQVNGGTTSPPGAKKWSGVVNGSGTPTTAGKATPREPASTSKTSAKDSKVAYILFYEKIQG